MGMVIKHGGRRCRVCSGDGDLPGRPRRYWGAPLPFQHLLPLDTPYLWPLLQIGWENVWKNSPGLLWLVKEATRSLFSFLSSDFILFIKSIWREEGKGSGPWGTRNF